MKNGQITCLKTCAMVSPMQQLSLFKTKPQLFHGGALTGRRKTRRPLCAKRPIHIVLKSRKRNLFSQKIFLEKKMPLSKIADERKMTKETIVAHIEKLQESGKCPDIGYLRHELKKSEMDAILSAFDETGTKTLSHVYNLLSKQKLHPDYFKIRLARLFLTE
jgi:uncharacterized protein YwbE